MVMSGVVVEEEETKLKSLCVRNCCLDEKKVCMGCGRSLPEILEWHRADASRQAQIKHNAENRLSTRQSF